MNREMDRSVESCSKYESESGRGINVGFREECCRGVVDDGLDLYVQVLPRTRVLDEITQILTKESICSKEALSHA